MSDKFRLTTPRRKFLTAAAAVGGLQFTGPFIIKARGETPVKIGFIDPITGSLSALAVSEVEGAKWTVEQMNKKGGILGRPVELLVEDSANDTGTGVQKAHKLIERDNVDIIMGDVNSGIAYAIMGVTSDKKIFHIVPGGHTDPITGKDCKWNTFRTCNTTAMDASAVTGELVKRFGKKWFFITPDYAYGQTLQANFVKKLTELGGDLAGRHAADRQLRLLGDADQGQGLQARRAAEQHGRLGPDQLHEAVRAVRHEQGHGAGRRAVRDRIGAVRAEGSPDRLVDHGMVVGPARRAGGEAVRRCDFPRDRRQEADGAALDVLCLAARRAPGGGKGQVARCGEDGEALSGLELPPEVSLMPGKIQYRAGDHQLMSNIFVGQMHPPGPAGPDDLFKIEADGHRRAGRRTR